jgi:hypothetical protein
MTAYYLLHEYPRPNPEDVAPIVRVIPSSCNVISPPPE